MKSAASRWWIVLAAAACACGGADASPATGVSVEELTENGEAGDAALALEDDPFPDDVEEVADDVAPEDQEAKDDAVQEEEAIAELEVEAEPLVVESAPARRPRCKKRIRATFAAYTYLTPDVAKMSNGCWIPERTVQDPDFRGCHYPSGEKHASGTQWYYDDTNVAHSPSLEAARIRACARGERRGYEYLAFRGGWRLVRAHNLRAYFAELYSDDFHVDDLYYAPGVYRGNTRLRHRGVHPMVAIGAESVHKAAVETLKICKTVRNHGYLGLYENSRNRLASDSPRLRAIVRALNACTRAKR